MTEQEWLSSNNPVALLEHAMTGRKCDNSLYCPSERKLRLFACACVRQVWHLLMDQHSRKLVETAEKYADGEISHRELEKVWTEACMISDAMHYTSLVHWIVPMYTNTIQLSVGELLDDLRIVAEIDYRSIQSNLLREIVGNPFRRYLLTDKWIMNPEAFGFTDVIDTRWFNSTVIALAHAAYDHQDWSSLPILADALEEAGCIGELCDCGNDWCPPGHRKPHPLLAHLRSSGPHVKGCWALDLILGKS